MVTTRPPKTIVKPTAPGPVANTDTKLLIYGLFQRGRVLAQDGMPRTRAETWIQARAAPGPERASRLRRGSPGLDSGPLGQPLFRRCTALSATRSPLWRKRGTRKSRLETKTENEAHSALLARLWCHLILQNPANRAENLTRLCSATIGQTGWRMASCAKTRPF